MKEKRQTNLWKWLQMIMPWTLAHWMIPGMSLNQGLKKILHCLRWLQMPLTLHWPIPGKCMFCMMTLENWPWKACHLCMWVFRGRTWWLMKKPGRTLTILHLLMKTHIIKSNWPMTIRTRESVMFTSHRILPTLTNGASCNTLTPCRKVKMVRQRQMPFWNCITKRPVTWKSPML